MRGGKNKTGYTITEVLIVLAISSAMFIAANAFLSGRVAETNFRTGTNEMASRLQDTINQVSSGQYSDIAKGNCTVDAGTGALSFDSTSTAQGTNINCVFIGKFYTYTSDNNPYKVELVAGKKESTDLTTSNPKIINNTQTNFNIPGGLKYKSVTGWQMQFAIIQNPAGSSPSSLNSNSVLLTDASMSSVLSTVKLCVSDGSRSAILTIGDNNNSLGVSTEFKYRSANCS
jgi:hypothetical protein